MRSLIAASTRKFESLLRGVGILLLFCGVSSIRAYAGDMGSRPIEFSEPIGAESPSTDPNFTGSNLKSSSQLDDQISKRFEFLNLQDSLRGAPTFQAPVRMPRSTTPSSSAMKDENWLQPDFLKHDEGPLSKGLLGDRRVDSKESDFFGNKSGSPSDTLESLRSEGWLVQGTMGQSFRDIPLADENSYSPQTKPWEGLAGKEPGGDKRRFNGGSAHQLDRTFERLSQTDVDFNTPESRTSFFTGSEGAFDSGAYSRRSTEMNRREEYRNLFGLTPKSSDGVSSILSPNPNHLTDNRPTTRIQNLPNYTLPDITGFAPSLGGSPGFHSYLPARNSDRNNLFPGGTSPSKKSGTFDLPDAKQPNSILNSPRDQLSNPLYQPPRRQF